jgi:integrase
MAITIAKIPNRSGFKYKAHVKKNGKNLKIKTFTRKADARTWAKRIEADFELMEALGCKGSSLTLSQLADEYLDNWSGKDTNQVPRVAFWVTVLGHYHLVDITATVVREALEALGKGLCKRGDGLGRAKNLDRNPAPATINRYRAVLSSMLKYAVSQGYITSNTVAKVPTKALNNKIVRYLSDTERQDLLAACRKSSWKPLYRLVLLAMTTGMRKAELMNLRWSDIDFSRSVAMLATTKNGEPRHCPIPSVALVELKAIREVGDGLVFPSEKIPTKPFEFRKHWAKAINIAGIIEFRFHDLRHTAASYMVMNGMSLYETATVLGHKDTQTTTRYAHLSTEHVSRLTESAMSAVLD